MKSFVVEDGKKRFEFISGLGWHPLVPEKLRTSLKPLSNVFDSTFYVYLRTEKSIVGLSRPELGSEDVAKEGLISAALVIAVSFESENTVQSSLTAVEMPGHPGQYLYVARNAGQILSDKDGYGDREEILKRISEDFAHGGWEQIVCPDDWYIPGSTERSFESYLPVKGGRITIPKAWRIKVINVPIQRIIAPIFVGVVVLLVGYFGYGQWKTIQAREIAQRVEQQRAQEEAKARQQAITREPWRDEPSAESVGMACEQSIFANATEVPNWTLLGVECDKNSMTTSWERSSPGAFVSVLKSLKPNAVIEMNGISASNKSAVSVENKPVGTEVPMGRTQLIEHYADYGRRYGIEMKFLERKEVQAGVQQMSDGLLPKWKALDFNASSKLSLGTTVGLLDTPTLRILGIKGKKSEAILKYEISGVMYVQ
jgi:hypothetical protein